MTVSWEPPQTIVTKDDNSLATLVPDGVSERCVTHSPSRRISCCCGTKSACLTACWLLLPSAVVEVLPIRASLLPEAPSVDESERLLCLLFFWLRHRLRERQLLLACGHSDPSAPSASTDQRNLRTPWHKSGVTSGISKSGRQRPDQLGSIVSPWQFAVPPANADR